MANPFVTDGQVAFDGGVNSVKVPTIASQNNPNGLARNQSAWLANATCRGGGISPRASWLKRLTVFDQNSLKLTISGAGDSAVNGDYVINPAGSGPQNGIYYYGWIKETTATIGYSATQGWQILDGGLGVVYQSDETVRNPAYIKTWNLVGGGTDPKPTIVSSGVVIENPLYQGAKFYEPDSGDPYILALVSGHVILVDPTDTNPPRDLSGEFNLYHPATTPKAYFEQAENYMVIQAGDYDPISGNGTLPLIWDGSTLSRSNGITGTTVVGTPTQNIYTLNTTSTWTVPPVASSVNISLEKAYPANQWDVLTIAISPAAVGPHAGSTIGVFRVTAILGNTITALCESLTGSVPNGTALSVADTPLVLTSTTPSPANPTMNAAVTTLNCTAATGTVGANPVTLTFTAGTGMGGSAGDYIYIWHGAGSTPYGVFQITNPSSGAGGNQAVFKPIYPQNVGSTFVGQFSYLIFNGANPPSYLPKTHLIIPDTGNTITVTSTELYPGSVNDLVSIPNCGVFSVVSFGNINGNTWFDLTLKAVSPVNVGTIFPFGKTMDQIGAVSNFDYTATITQSPSTIGTLINQIPAATVMRFYQNRLWYAQGRTVSAGDIVGDTSSGTVKNGYRDAVLCVTENPLIIGGDGFSVPSNAGDITGLEYAVNINQPLGQGPLYVGTKKQIYSLTVPVSRSDWISATANNQPLFVPVQKSSGWVSDRCIVVVNEDLFYFNPKKQIQSLIQATRYFGQWGNTPISSNERRITSLIDADLLPYVSGVYFDNRLLVTCLPQQTTQGVVSTAIVPLDFETISTFETKLPPAWEGHHEGLKIFQLVYNEDSDEVYAFTLGNDNSIQLWQIMADDQYQTTDPKFQYRVETPAFTCQSEFDLKKMIGGEFWFDQIRGDVDFLVEYRPDGATCWEKWYAWKECFNTQADTYPATEAAPGYSQPRTMPKPPDTCQAVSGRPAYIAHQQQIRLTVTGRARLRGFLIYFEPVVRSIYEGLNR